MSLLPVAEQNWLADMDRAEVQTFATGDGSYIHLISAFNALDSSLRGRATTDSQGAISLAELNAAERGQLAEKLRSVAEAARDFESVLLIYAAYNEYIFSTPHDRLGDKQEVERFSQINQGNFAPHGDLRFIFMAP